MAADVCLDPPFLNSSIWLLRTKCSLLIVLLSPRAVVLHKPFTSYPGVSLRYTQRKDADVTTCPRRLFWGHVMPLMSSHLCSICTILNKLYHRWLQLRFMMPYFFWSVRLGWFTDVIVMENMDGKIHAFPWATRWRSVPSKMLDIWASNGPFVITLFTVSHVLLPLSVMEKGISEKKSFLSNYGIMKF